MWFTSLQPGLRASQRALSGRGAATVPCTFSWIVYESRAQRDAINAKVMADPRLKGDMLGMPFDGRRMIHGGFETFLEL